MYENAKYVNHDLSDFEDLQAFCQKMVENNPHCRMMALVPAEENDDEEDEKEVPSLFPLPLS